MRSPRPLLLAIIATGLFVACSSPETDATPPPAKQVADEGAPEGEIASNASVADSDLSDAEGSEVIDFSYSVPPLVRQIPSIQALLSAHATAARAKYAAEATDFQEEAEREGFPFRRYEYDMKWSIVADTPSLLALVGETYIYRGGAHGGTEFASLIWDRESGRQLEITDLFSDLDAALATLTPLYCEGLDAERAKKRGQPVAKDGGPFDQCPPLGRQTIVPAARSSHAERAPPEEASDLIERDRIASIRVLLAPYEAGPYADGSYVVDVPVTDAVRALIKPGYREVF